MPDAGPAVNAAPCRFRHSLGWALARQFTVMGGSLGVVWGGGLAAGIFTPPPLYMAGTMMTLVTVATVALCVWRLTLQPRPDGLVVAQLIGRPVVIAWDRIEAVRPGGVSHIAHILLTVRGWRRPVAVPLRLNDLPGFADAVAEFAGDDHPLADALHDRLTGG